MAVRIDRGRYVVEFQQAGIRVFRRLPTGVTKAQAQEWETKRRRELFDVGPLGNKPEITLPAAIQAWLENNRRSNQAKALSEAKQWEPFVAGKLLREAPEVAQEAIARWTAAKYATSKTRSAQGVAKPSTSATINRRLCVLKAAAKLAYRRGWIQENVGARIQLFTEKNQREVYLTKAQVMRLATCAPDTVTASAIIIAAYTGLRASELLALGKVTSRTATLSVVKSKTGKPRIVPVAGPCRPYLRALPLGISYWTLHDAFLVARKKAKLPHVRFHDLRHTCASWLINEDVDLYTVGKILGHTSTQTTARYSHLADKTLRRAMARLK